MQFCHVTRRGTPVSHHHWVHAGEVSPYHRSKRDLHSITSASLGPLPRFQKACFHRSHSGRRIRLESSNPSQTDKACFCACYCGHNDHHHCFLRWKYSHRRKTRTRCRRNVNSPNKDSVRFKLVVVPPLQARGLARCR